MREIVLDTETTGLDPKAGHRVVEIGGVELINFIPTGITYQQYINPEREMPLGAFEVHGLSESFLADFPTFQGVARGLIEFLGDATLVIHNASFDMGFLNAELRLLNLPPIENVRAKDTLALARKRYPGAQNSLDALCRRLDVDNTGRTKHGALLDAELLAEVYLELIGGRQPGLSLSSDNAKIVTESVRVERPARPHTPTSEELAAHVAFIREELEDALWLRDDD